MKTVRRDFLESVRNPAGLGATIRGLDTRIQRVERAKVKFDFRKPDPPIRAPDASVPGQQGEPTVSHGVTSGPITLPMLQVQGGSESGTGAATFPHFSAQGSGALTVFAVESDRSHGYLGGGVATFNIPEASTLTKVAIIAINYTNAAALTLALSGDLTWTLQAQLTSGLSLNYNTAVYTAPLAGGTVGSPKSVTVTPSAACDWNYDVYIVDAVDTTTPVVQADIEEALGDTVNLSLATFASEANACLVLTRRNPGTPNWHDTDFSDVSIVGSDYYWQAGYAVGTHSPTVTRGANGSGFVTAVALELAVA